VPIILVGVDYWKNMHHFVKEEMFGKHRTIDAIDMDLYTITDDFEQILKIIEQVPVKGATNKKPVQ
jgi:predicted Rossmann-fold nucleotide-binding protein